MDDPGERLRATGLRVTQPRLAVLSEVATHPHADVASIVTGARSRLGSVSTQAVYGVVNALTDAGLLRRIEPAGSPARFELETGDNHHHLVCRQCGRILDVACATGAAPCLHPDEESGFQIDEAEVTYWGRCPDCRAVAPGATADEPATQPHRHCTTTTNGDVDDHDHDRP